MSKITCSFLFAFSITLASSVEAAPAKIVRFTVFKDNAQCQAAAAIIDYLPIVIHPFKGGGDWVKEVVGKGGACLTGPYVYEDGGGKTVGAVHVAEGFVTWKNKITGARVMGICSDPFSGLFPTRTFHKDT